MASKRTRPKTIRIENEIADWMDSYAFNDVVRSLYDLWQGGIVKISDGELKISGVHTDLGISDEKMDDLNAMLGCFGTDLSGLLESFQEQMDEGSVFLENGRIKGECEVDIDRFLEACEEKMVDPQEMIEKATEMILKG